MRYTNRFYLAVNCFYTFDAMGYWVKQDLELSYWVATWWLPLLIIIIGIFELIN